MKVKRKKGYYSISAVAKMFSVHQQTIRLYEKEGLITPKRSDGNTRLFTEEDIDKLEEVIYLTHELGINLAGVEMILKLKKQIGKLQAEINKLFKHTQDQLDEQSEIARELATVRAKKLAALKNTNITTTVVERPTCADSTDVTEPDPDFVHWEIDYEE
jgi:MerR family transcriptional regulator, heat shock protein HspR